MKICTNVQNENEMYKMRMNEINYFRHLTNVRIIN